MPDIIRIALEVPDEDRTRKAISDDPRMFGVLMRDVLSSACSLSERLTLEREYGVRVSSTTTEYERR